MGDDHSLSEKLQTLTSEDPGEIRRELVSTLRDFVPSNLALFVKVAVDDDGRRYFTGQAMNGDVDAKSLVENAMNKPVVDTPWLDETDPAIINNFVRTRTYYEDEYLDAFEVVKVVFAPMESNDELRTVLADGSHFLGWLGLIRRGPDGLFTAREEETIQRAGAAIKSVLATAEALESETLADELFAVVRPTGVIDHASAAFRRWIDDDRCAHLKRKIQRIDAGHAPASVEIVDGAEVRIVRLDGPTGVRYGVTVDKAELMRLRPEEWLTPRQREVARLAVSGASNAEIGDILGISPETAKSHLKAIYRRLRVDNRTELAALLSHLAE